MKPRMELGTARKLLLALVGCQGEAQDTAMWLPLLRQLDWSDFLAISSQDLYPYLAFRLEPYMARVEAPPEWELFSSARRLTAVHNLGMRHELGRVINALQECDIPALALKGIILAYTIYPNLSLRPMSDLDLLIPPGKREKALLAIQRLGFEYPETVFTTHRDHFCRLAPEEEEYAPPLRLRGSSVLLEVHSELPCSEPLVPIPVEEFWSRSVAVQIMGLKLRTLCPEDFLFHLCLHQSRSHRFEKGLLPLIDLRLLLGSRRDWDWPSIATRSIRCGCATWMYLTLGAARDLTGAPVPESFFQALPQPQDLLSLRCLVEEQIWSARSGTSIVPGFVQKLLAEHSWRRRVRLLFTRMRLIGREEIDPKLTPTSLIQRAQLVHRRLLATFRVKIPQYVRAWKNGQLRPRAIWRTASLLRKANKLFQLVVQQEASRARDKDQVGQE